MQDPVMQLNWGILGASAIADKFVSVVSTLDHHNFLLVGSRDYAKAVEFANSHDIPQAFGSYDEVLADSNVNIVYISLINSLHKEWTIKALQAGKHVLCEKPLGLNVKECERMFEAAMQNRRFLMEGHWTRFFPSYLELKQTIDNGEIGDIKFISGTFTKAGLGASNAARVDPKLGGGALYAGGYYGPALTTFLFDGAMPEVIEAYGDLADSGCDNSEVFTLKYANGAVCQFLVASNCAVNHQCTIVGTKGGFNMTKFWAPATIQACINQSQSELGRPLPAISTSNKIRPHSPGFVYEAEHIRECLDKGLLQSPIMPASHTLTIAQIMCDIKDKIGLKHQADIPT